MVLEELFERWKINRNLVASEIKMPKGTFNNKMNPMHASHFSIEEQRSVKNVLLKMSKDINSYLLQYPVLGEDEDFDREDEPRAPYGGR